jgi:myo-inositol-1(or 4)-monophosphatase
VSYRKNGDWQSVFSRVLTLAFQSCPGRRPGAREPRLVESERSADALRLEDGMVRDVTSRIEELVQFAHRLADASGEVIRPWFRSSLDVTDKGTGRAGFDPVTEADREGEAVLRRLIKEVYPGHGILGEEHGREEGTEPFTWVLDPIDGTRAFICGMPQWGTLIALNDGSRPILGVLDQPVTRERWIGWSGHAELVTPSKTTKIKTRPCADLGDAVVTTTHPTAYFTKEEADAFQVIGQRAKMTRYGGDCYAYALLAMGFIDLVIEASLKPWDIQALIPIIEGAGGIFTSWDGGDAQNGGRVIAAGDARVHAQALEILRNVPQ